MKLIADLLKDRNIFEFRIDICYQNEIRIEKFNPDSGACDDIWIRWEEKPEKKRKSIAVWA